MNVRLLMALAFVPPVDVAAYEEIVSTEYYEVHGDILESLLDYFELTSIGTVRHNKNKRQKPLFPINMSNCYNAIMDDLNRSNSPCEGWNVGFNIRVGQPHAVMAGFIQSLKDE